MGIVADREQILESFQLIKPTVLVSVPALFNRIYDGIITKVSEAPPIRQKLFKLARDAKRSYNDDLEFGRNPCPTALDCDETTIDIAIPVLSFSGRCSACGHVRFSHSTGRRK